VVEAFIKEVLKLQDTAVRYLAVAGTWSVTFNDWAARQSVACIQEYGTRRMHAIDLVQHALNVQTLTVRDPHPEKDGAYIVNKEETLAAREKLGLIRDRFAAWAYEDAPRRERLCRIYNDLFNCIRQREFDGSHLKLPGFSQCFELHASQRNAIWRVVQSGNTGLFHAVGAGKTAIMVAASMELRRLGLANKPAHIVPNGYAQLSVDVKFLPNQQLRPGAVAPALRRVFALGIALAQSRSKLGNFVSSQRVPQTGERPFTGHPL
jgi:N12 class adenine-specific DNA methylase